MCWAKVLARDRFGPCFSRLKICSMIQLLSHVDYRCILLLFSSNDISGSHKQKLGLRDGYVILSMHNFDMVQHKETYYTVHIYTLLEQNPLVTTPWTSSGWWLRDTEEPVLTSMQSDFSLMITMDMRGVTTSWWCTSTGFLLWGSVFHIVHRFSACVVGVNVRTLAMAQFGNMP